MPSEQHQQVVALLRELAAQAPDLPSYEEARASLEASGAIFPVPEDVEVQPFEVDGIPCERSHPSGADAADLLLYLHGGSYTAGSLASHRSLVARLARACGRDAVAVDYRLAPEHPHPAGLDDAGTVYRRLVDDGTDPARIVVAGDSAGGGLVTALLLRLRDEGALLPAGAVLLSPWLDLTLTAAAITEKAAADPMLRATSLARSAADYAGDDLRRPLVSPVLADLAGLPPLLVLVGTAEILLDDSLTFASRAREAGVSVDLQVEEGLVHVWPFLDGVPEAADALERISSWVAVRTGS
ncbi:MAG TPA: alpha/beta hydrolase [Aquihabitans sp.]|jgi:acetyl esterase/lipase|nr:alpha/beta hydrolase [Aquihabitans sp.]